MGSTGCPVVVGLSGPKPLPHVHSVPSSLIPAAHVPVIATRLGSMMMSRGCSRGVSVMVGLLSWQAVRVSKVMRVSVERVAFLIMVWFLWLSLEI